MHACMHTWWELQTAVLVRGLDASAKVRSHVREMLFGYARKHQVMHAVLCMVYV
jgi:hypothetical protein